MAYPAPVTRRIHPPRPRRLAALLAFGSVLLAGPAAAQGLLPVTGFASLPALSWPEAGEGRWAGSRARLSTGFEAVSSRRGGSYAGPTIGFDGQRLWQEGPFVYGIAGRFDYLAAIGGGPTPGFGGFALSRDLAGAAHVKVGALVAPDVLVYATAGAQVVREKLSFGATPSSLPFSREDIVVRPDARVGVEWAVTDRLTLGVEAGIVGPALR